MKLFAIVLLALIALAAGKPAGPLAQIAAGLTSAAAGTGGAILGKRPRSTPPN